MKACRAAKGSGAPMAALAASATASLLRTYSPPVLTMLSRTTIKAMRRRYRSEETISKAPRDPGEEEPLLRGVEQTAHALPLTRHVRNKLPAINAPAIRSKRL